MISSDIGNLLNIKRHENFRYRKYKAILERKQKLGQKIIKEWFKSQKYC